MQVARHPLDFMLQMACGDLRCYGESYVPGEDGKITFRYWSAGEEFVSEEVREFAETAGTESYAIDVGIPGTASAEGTYKIRSIRDLVDDKFFFSSGGPRLAASANIFRTVVTVPVRRLPWSRDVERLRLRHLNIASCLRYRQTDLIGIVILYLVRSPKLASELEQYLDSLVHCASPLVDLFTERDRYLRRVDRGGNKYRRLRRAILAAARSGKKLPGDQKTSVVTVHEAKEMPTVHVTPTGEEKADEDEGSSLKMLPLDLEAGRPPSEAVKPTMAKRPDQFQLLLRRGLKMSKAYFRKYVGGSVDLPTRVDVRLSAIAFVGAFVTISCWQVMTDAINGRNDWRGVVDAFTLPGSFGALCSIVFALPAVPLAQPRVILYAHTWALAVSIALTFIFAQYHHIWLQKALAVAFTVAGMAKLGCINPPAGSVSLIVMTYVNSSSYSAPGLLFLVVSMNLGCAVCILVGVVWHNCFTGRTYPLYW